MSWAVNKCHYFLYEAPFIDHYTDSTGVAGLMKKDLCEVRNPRLQRILEKVVSYNIISHHIPASKNGFSDYFLCFPSTGFCTALEYDFEKPQFRVNVEGPTRMGKNIINKVVRTEQTFDRSDPWLIQISREEEDCPQFRELKELVLMKNTL